MAYKLDRAMHQLDRLQRQQQGEFAPPLVNARVAIGQ